MKRHDKKTVRESKVTRRAFLQASAIGAAAAALPAAKADASIWEAFFQKHFREMNPDEVQRVLERLEGELAEKFGVDISVKATKPLPGVLFGYGLDISRCIGCRRCVAISTCRPNANSVRTRPA
jgi:molybdopterin-containing oxidoreductase family iron-sulfur binding subunit